MIPILMYHHVSTHAPASFRKYVVSPQAFADQMTWLAVGGYTPVSLDRIVAHWRGRGTLPPRSVVITFDDGYRDCLEHTVPILQARRFPAVFYVVAGLVGAPSRWLRAERGFELQLAGWPALRALERAGLECGSHTMTHPRLPRLDAEACHTELRDARATLEDALGRRVLHLAYPFGAWDERVASIAAEAGYTTACTVRPGIARRTDRLLALPRVPVLGDDTVFDFACRLTTARSVRELVHGGLAAVRRRLPRARLA